MRRAVTVAAGAALAALAGLVAGGGAGRAQDLDMHQIFRCGDASAAGQAACDFARDTILLRCTGCHFFVRIVVKQADATGWRSIIDRHRDRVPELSAAEFDAIEAYLVANFRPDLPPPDLPPEIRAEVDNPL